MIHIPWIDFGGIPAGDTKGYIDVSENWYSSAHIYIRPILYPIFIFFAKLINPSEYGAIVSIQILFYSLSAVLFYKILIANNTGLNKFVLAVIVAIAFSAPQALYANQIVLPEVLPLFFILLLIHYLLKPASFKNALFISLFIIMPIFLKPLWMILLVFPLLKYIYSKKNIKNLVFGLVIPTIFSLIIYATNQSIVAKSGTNVLAASTFDINTNLSLIRMGSIDADEESPLYTFLEHKNLISEISGRNWDNSKKEFDRFTKIKNQIPTKYREDPTFWKSILLENPKYLFNYLTFQITRIPAFFSTSAANYNVDFLPKQLNRLYQSFFYNIHSKHIVGICFILFSLFIGIFNFKELSLHKILFFLIIGTTSVICLLVYQNSHYIRMRAVIEPLIIYVSLYSLYTVLNYLRKKIIFNFRTT